MKTKRSIVVFYYIYYSKCKVSTLQYIYTQVKYYYFIKCLDIKTIQLKSKILCIQNRNMQC